MFGMTLIRPNPAMLLFLLVVSGVYGVSLFAAGLLHGRDDAEMLALASTLDMIVLVPAAYYFLFVRRGKIGAISLVPVVVLSVILAGQVIPQEHQGWIDWLEWIIIPIELGLIAYIVIKARRALASQADADPVSRIRAAARSLAGDSLFARAFGSEVAFFYYGFCAWRAQAHQPTDCQAFSYHKRNGHGPLLAVLLMLFAIEGFAIHLLLESWSPVFAWIMTAGTLYGGLWFIADFRAMQLRPNLVDAESIHLRSGLRFELSIARDQLESISKAIPASGQQVLNLTLLGTPTHWLHLREPVQALGPYGFRRSAQVIGLQVDDANAFEALLGPGLIKHAG